MRVRIPGNRGLRELQIGQSVLRFGPDGYAEADHLSDEEIQRCIDFCFVVEGGSASEDQADAGDEAPADEGSPDEPARKPRRKPGPRRTGKGTD